MSAMEESSGWTEARASNRRSERLNEVRKRVVQEGLDILDCSAITLGRKIGEGGQGTIYEASWDSGMYPKPQPVVVKKFKPLKGIAQGHFPPQLWSLNLMNICKPFGVFFDRDESLCMLMPRFSSDLRTLIDSHRHNEDGDAPFSQDVAVSIITRLAVTFKALHKFGIYHRDIKAANILVQTCPSSPAQDVLVADFENSDGVVGTGFWRAPEILQALDVFSEDRAPLSGKQLQAADVYSFGMTCYEILTGNTPFDDHRWSDYNLVLSGGRPELPGHVPEPLKNLIRRCWNQNPDSRPSFAEIVILLEESYTIAGHFVSFQDTMTSVGELSETFLDVPLESCLAKLKETLLTPRELHALRLINPAAAHHERVLADCISTSEEFVSKFGWDSYRRHPWLPFAAFVERRRLVSLILHKFQQCDHTVEKLQKGLDLSSDENMRLQVSQVWRLVPRKFLTDKVAKWIREGETQSNMLREEESELTSWIEKFAILEDFIYSLCDAGVLRAQTFKAVARIDAKLHMLEGESYTEVRIKNKVCLKWTCMIFFYPFYGSRMANLLGTLFSYETILLYLGYEMSGCRDLVFSFTGYSISGFHEVLLAYLAVRADGVSPYFRYYCFWKHFGLIGLLVYCLSCWALSKPRWKYLNTVS